MPKDLSHKLIIAISSSALFDLTESNLIFEQQGVEAYAKYQTEREQVPLQPGVGFPLVKKLLQLNKAGDRVEIILLSRNSADTGLRIFNSIQTYGLDITRAAFTSGHSPYRYISAFGSHLFLSTHGTDVKNALAGGCAAATLLAANGSALQTEIENHEIRIAFDGDSVLFSDEAEQVFQREGLEKFNESERLCAQTPLQQGPFKGFLMALQRLQKHFPEAACPIQTALVTARAAPSHERVIRTLRAWDIRIDEALFLGGLSKAEFLNAFGADIFFDDRDQNCQAASLHVTSAHVPHGIVNA